MAGEAGAEFSGMEFSTAYAIVPYFSPVTKTALYQFATFYYEDGRVIDGAGSRRGRSIIAKTLLKEPVYACLDKADKALQVSMRKAQPNFFLSFDRLKIDPFTEKFPITLRFEGTVRGTGGINIVDETCATKVPGLFAAGDAATRELICGGFTGGGSIMQLGNVIGVLGRRRRCPLCLEAGRESFQPQCPRLIRTVRRACTSGRLPEPDKYGGSCPPCTG